MTRARLGASDAPSGEYTIHGTIGTGRDCPRRRALQIRKFAFAGLSLGGMIGQWIGANAPNRLTALVLANTSPHVPPKSNWDDRRRGVLEHGMSSIVDMAMGRFFSAETLAKDDPGVNAIRTTFSRDQSGGLCRLLFGHSRHGSQTFAREDRRAHAYNCWRQGCVYPVGRPWRRSCPGHSRCEGRSPSDRAPLQHRSTGAVHLRHRRFFAAQAAKLTPHSREAFGGKPSKR